MILERSQTKAHDAHRGLRLSAFIPSPYMNEMSGIGRRQGYPTIFDLMKAITGLDYAFGSPNSGIGTAFYTGTTLTEALNLPFDLADGTSTAGLKTTIEAAIAAYAVVQGYTLSEGIVWLPAGSVATPPAVSNPTRALNTAYQVTGNTLVVGSIEQDASLSLSGGTKSTVTLKYADDSGFTTGVTTASVSPNGNTGTLTIGLNTVQAGGGNVVGFVPSGKYYKFITANSTGTSTNTLLNVQEIAF